MDVIRRNTDYALRLIVNLVENLETGPVSARQLAKNSDVPYELACKMLQKLSSAKLIKSRMGANGGFELAKKAERINLYQVIEAIQGGICLNRCIPDAKSCPRRPRCVVSRKLVSLQKYIEDYLKDITLEQLLA
ncbi:MAG: Rrf2 family transcriptional regulator [Sedimentisphaerales bacterium]|nr:Rrf2 family transcriptional regulator [Sedimentisphaerales bacterium]